MNVRHAAKGLISYGTDSYLFVAGRRGRWNIPGGGIDAGETPRQAFLREANEEVTNLTYHITDPVEAGTVEGIVTPMKGAACLARWVVHTSTLVVPPETLTIADTSEITGLQTMTATECMARDDVSDLAKQAIVMFAR